MRLNQFLNESRSKEIKKIMFDKYLEQKCSSAVKWKTEIYRGVYPSPGEYGYVSPSKSKEDRKSPYATNNVYNLLFSNLPSWSSYPKRNKSIICTTSKFVALDSYGVPHRIFPFNGAKIGVCPEDDIWNSFKKLPMANLNEINVLVEKLAGQVGLEHSYDKSYSDLLKLFNIIDDHKINNKDRFLNDFEDRWSRTGQRYMLMLSQMGYFDKPELKLIDLFNNVLSPLNNGFRLIVVGTVTLPSNVEVWTDSDSLLQRLYPGVICINEIN